MDEIARLETKCSELRNDKAFMAGALHEIYERSHDPEIETLAQAAMEEHSGERDGTEALLRDVIAVPRDKDAKRLVEAIRAQACLDDNDVGLLATRLGIIQGDAERLAVLLDERDAEREALRDSLTWALEELQKAYGAVWEKNDWEHYRPVMDARAALARAKGEA
jgi:hypothetical protein